MTTSGRLSWVDYAKGIGIVLVVLGHVIGGLDLSSAGESRVYYEKLISVIYGFHMPLFFFLSGLFVEKSLRRGFKEGLGSKVKTVLWPYILWSLIQGVISVILSNYTNAKMSWSELTKIPYEPIFQFWFLYALFIFFTLYFVIRKVFSVDVIFAVSLGFFACYPISGVWVTERITFNFVFFVLGAFIVKVQPTFVEKYLSKYVALLGSIILFASLNWIYLNVTLAEYPEALLMLVLGFVGIALVISISSFMSKISAFKFVEYMGLLSFPIYLAHTLAGAATRIGLSKVLHINDFTINVVAGTIAGLVLPIIMVKVIEVTRLDAIAFGTKPKPLTPRTSGRIRTT